MSNSPTPLAAIFVDVFHVEMNGAHSTITLGQVRDGTVVYHSAVVMPTPTALELAASLQSLRVTVAERAKAAAAQPTKKGGAGKRRGH